jgi:hypothetical protein
MSVRREVVEAVTQALAESEQGLSERLRAVGELGPTSEEMHAASALLAAASLRVLTELGAVPVPPSLLDMNFHQLTWLGWQGKAMLALADDLSPIWAPWPDKPLSDQLKIVPPDQLHRIAALLRKVGLHDLDEVLP